ncbi:hypothetical protein FO519_003385 [Halicephalobus sp. NKZ332]|nr:hypothetical protein FO519_003385 [Halicephalobus sp. NKZ332]
MNNADLSANSVESRVPDFSPSEATALDAAARNNVLIVNSGGLSPMGFLNNFRLDIPIGPPPPIPSPYFPILPRELVKHIFNPPKYFHDPDRVIANYRHPDIPVLGLPEDRDAKNTSNSHFQSPTTTNLSYKTPVFRDDDFDNYSKESADVNISNNSKNTVSQEMKDFTSSFSSSMPILETQFKTPTTSRSFTRSSVDKSMMLNSELVANRASTYESRKCDVCGDKVSGYTYRTSACNACRTFFRRVTRKNTTFNCQEENNCSINKKNRTNCPACRFHKCVLIGLRDETIGSNIFANHEVVDEDDDGNIKENTDVDEKELVKRCVKLADVVSNSFKQHFGSFRANLAQNSVAPVLKFSSIDELRDAVESFIGSISKSGELTEEEKTELANYGMRAFIALVCSLSQQVKPSLSNQPLFKVLRQTPGDLDLLARFDFREITDDEIAIMCASSLIQPSMFGLGNHKVIDNLSRQLARCLYYKLNERVDEKSMKILDAFCGFLCKLYY